jgi:hypothetical protein
VAGTVVVGTVVTGAAVAAVVVVASAVVASADEVVGRAVGCVLEAHPVIARADATSAVRSRGTSGGCGVHEFEHFFG